MVNRIRELLDVRQLSPTQFADLIGVGRPVISHILSERNKPSLEVVQKILDAFPDVALAWLMKGSGPMLTAAVPASIPPTALLTPSLSASPDVTAPLAVAPTPPPAPFVAPPAALAPVAAAVALTPTPTLAAPPRLPHPPKFRPGAKLSALPEVPPSSPTPSTADAPVAMPPAPQVATPAPEPVAATGLHWPLVPTGPVAALATEPALPELRPLPSPPSVENTVAASTPAAIPPPPIAPAANPQAALPATPNPAAAFSFLGEAGKTIRRIVLFYNDGSFSDYRPEGE